MASESFSTITSVLSQYYTAKLADQRNMDAIELAYVNVVPNDSGKNIAWVAKFPGDRNVTNFADDGTDIDAAEYTKTTKVPATLNFGNYRAPAKLTDFAAISAAVADGSPDDLRMLVDSEVKDSLMEITKQVAIDFYVGDGTAANGNPNIIGLAGGAALLTGTYAGVNRATYSQWAGSLLANGGTPRPLTDDLLRQGEIAAFNASGTGSTPKLILTTGNIHRKYAGLFSPVLRVNTPGPAPASLGMGTNDLFWSNMPVVRSSRAPAGKLFMIDTADVEFVIPKELLPLASVPMNPMVKKMGLDLKRGYMLPIVVEPLARTGNALKYNVWTYIQLRVRNPNRVVTIEDISEV